MARPLPEMELEKDCAAGHAGTSVSGDDIRALAELLGGRLQQGAAPPMAERCKPFYAIRPPGINILDYLARLTQWFWCSPECYVVASVYIGRLLRLHPDFEVSALTAHRLLLTSLVLAVKSTDDKLYSNKWYAKVGGVRKRDLNAMEVFLLELLGWRVHVPLEEYEHYHGQLRMLATSSCTAALQPCCGGSKRAKEPSGSAASTSSGDSPQLKNRAKHSIRGAARTCPKEAVSGWRSG